MFWSFAAPGQNSVEWQDEAEKITKTGKTHVIEEFIQKRVAVVFRMIKNVTVTELSNSR